MENLYLGRTKIKLFSGAPDDENKYHAVGRKNIYFRKLLNNQWMGTIKFFTVDNPH